MTRMRGLLVWVVLAIGFAPGCGPKGVTVVSGDGAKVTADGSGNLSIRDKDGTQVDYSAKEDGSWSAKSSKGEEVHATKNRLTLKNEKGETSTMGMSAVSEAELGLPFYPGSEPIENRDLKVESNGKKTYLSVRSTTDSAAKVIEYYKDKVKGPVTTSDKFGSVVGQLPDGREANIMAMAQDSGKTEIQISVSSAKP